MEHIAALLLIVGCSQDLNRCEELPAPVPVFETSGDCNTGLRDALATLDGDWPRIMGICVSVDPAMEEADAELVWDVTPDGALEASVEATEFDVAALGRNIPRQ